MSTVTAAISFSSATYISQSINQSINQRIYIAQRHNVSNALLRRVNTDQIKKF